MARVAGDSAQVRELGRKLLETTKEIISLNSRNQKLLDTLGQTSKDRSLAAAHEAVYEVAQAVLAGLDDVKETCGKLRGYADFLASMEEEGSFSFGGASGGAAASFAGLSAGLSQEGGGANTAGVSPKVGGANAAGFSQAGGGGAGGTTGSQLADHEFTHEEKLDWVRSVVPGCSPQEAE